MGIESAHYKITMPTGHVYVVPVQAIIDNRANYYYSRPTGEFDTLEDAVKDTLEAFAADPFEIEDWARNNMNFSDVANVAALIRFPEEPDFEEGWANGDVEILAEGELIR